MSAQGTVPCRRCGYGLDPQASICGNCGTVVRGGGLFGRPGAGPTPSGAPRGLIGGLFKIGLLIAVLGLAGGPVTEVVDRIRDAFESSGSPRQDDSGVPDVTVPGGAKRAAEGGPTRTKGYPSIRALVRALNRGGLRCGAVRVDAANEHIASGSCQAGGVHVQINIYLSDVTLEAAERAFDRDYPFSFVHDDNWYVISQDHIARAVKRAIGGRLVRAS